MTVTTVIQAVTTTAVFLVTSGILEASVKVRLGGYVLEVNTSPSIRLNRRTDIAVAQAA